MPRKIFANAHAYHINSISLNTDGETYISADDLRINLWNLETSDQSFSTRPLSATEKLIAFTHPNTAVVGPPTTDIVDIKPANMEELTEVITAAEFHPQSCNYLMYSSSKVSTKSWAIPPSIGSRVPQTCLTPLCASSIQGTIKLGDLRESALCDQHAKST